MSKHTKGPWGIEQTDDTNWIGFMRPHDGKVELIVCTTARDFTLKDEAREQNDANARLIAAAPELLEALSKAVRETEQFLFDAWLVRVCPSGDVESVQRQWLASGDHRDFVDEWREQIDAIAKATGEA